MSVDSTSNAWQIWICRCPGIFWANQPRHLTCADCHHLIREVTVKRA